MGACSWRSNKLSRESDLGWVGAGSTEELAVVSAAGTNAGACFRGTCSRGRGHGLRLRDAGGLRYQCERNGVGLDQEAAGWLISQQEINLRCVLAFATADQEKTDLACLSQWRSAGCSRHVRWSGP